MSFSKYYKEIFQISYDEGQTWVNYVDESGSFVYRKGDLYQSGLDTCEDVPPQPTVIYRWVDVDFAVEYDCDLINHIKYQIQKKQVSYNEGIEWQDVVPYTTQRKDGGQFEINSVDCGYVPPIEPIYRTIDGEYFCQDYDWRLYKLHQVSYDEGANWETTATTSVLIEANSEHCGYIPPIEPIYRTIDGEYFCEGYDLMQYQLHQVSYDNGTTWETTATTSVLIEANSEHCGYIPPTGDCNFMYYTSTDGNIVTPYSATSIDASIVSNTYTDEQGAMVFATCPTVFGERAFYRCSGFTSVIIPDTVNTIGKQAFNICSSLTSVTIPNSVTSIGESAFAACRSLPSVTIPNSVTSIGDKAFHTCTSLTSITIPNSVTSIGKEAFMSCLSLSSVTIPNTVTSIGERTFHNCSGLTSVTIPDSVTELGYEAFYGCESLTSVEIPDSVTSIGNGAFTWCSGLTSVIMGNSLETIGEDAFIMCSSLTSVTIPNSVTSIGDGAFWDCTSLTSIIMGNSLETIGEGAFQSCSSLTSVTIPNSVTSIGDNAFGSCSGLTSVTIGSGITSISNYAFQYCSGLTSVEIPNSVTSIGDDAFYYCLSLTSVIIPNSVTSIGSYAFMYCNKLTSVTYNDTIAQWNAITKGTDWKYRVPTTCKVHCTDGDIPIANA